MVPRPNLGGDSIFFSTSVHSTLSLKEKTTAPTVPSPCKTLFKGTMGLYHWTKFGYKLSYSLWLKLPLKELIWLIF